MKKKQKVFIALILSVLILTLGSGRIIQITKNHQANMPIMLECVESGGTLTVSQEHLFALITATCEEN